MSLLWIALGSGLGGSLRYALDLLVLQFASVNLPLATFLVNLSGSLLIGYLAGLWSSGERPSRNPHKSLFWINGFCGGYTTFSAFSWQVLEMIQAGHAQVAGFYAAASIGTGIIAVWLGLSLATRSRAAA